MRAMVDQSGCIGCGLCEATAPEVFQLSGGVAGVICDEVPSECEDAAQDARDGCPVSVISLEE